MSDDEYIELGSNISGSVLTGAVYRAGVRSSPSLGPFA
jgi:hypothetical protein